MARTELIRTKLGPPLVNTRWVARDEQVHHLDLALERALTVLAAPAGFGKTSLLAQWRNALARRGIPSAWVSLDRDDDLALFGAYVLTALADAYQGLGQRARALVRNDHLAPAKSVVAVLVNEIAEARHPVVLILDDLDRVDSPAVPEALARILRHAPANLHIVAAGRGDLPVPISALESQNRVLRIEADGLRFSVADTERFLVDVAGLRLANGDADRLWRATEGWVAGLQLAAIVARESGRMTTASQGLKGAAAGIARYLTENVLALMPAELADLALQVSILDRVSPALAEAVTGNRHAPALLGELEARNLFLLPLDEGRNWYRFHALFADYLRGRLMRERPAEVAELHRRASRWLAGQSLWLEAVRPALAAGDDAAAAEWVEQCAMALIERSDLRTLQTWLGRLPPAAIRGRVRLRLAQVWCDTLSLRPREAVAGLQAIEADLANGTLEAPDTEALRREVLAVQALTAGLTDDSTAALRLAETVLALSPAEGSWVQRIAETALGFGASYAGGIGQALAAPTSSSEREPAYAAVYRESMVGLSALVAGRLLEAEPFLDHALRVAEARAGVDSAAAALPAGYLSAVLYEWNETPQAEAVQRQRFPISLETAPNGSMTRFALTAARLADLAGDTAEALRRLDAARVVARDRNWLRALAACEGEKVRLLVRDRDLPSATRLLQALARRLPPGSPPSPPGSFAETPAYFSLAEARLLIARGDPAAAAVRLEALHSFLTRHGLAYFATQAQILLAIARFRDEAREAALAALTAALNYGRDNGLVRSFLDEGPEVVALLATLHEEPARHGSVLGWYLEDLLAAAGQTREAPVGLLSAREHDILGHLARGLSNKEIARDLRLAPETVKWHLKNIFGKLQVTSRLQAARWARSHGIITPSAGPLA